MATENTRDQGASLTSVDSGMIRRMESLDDRFRSLMNRSFQFVQKCGEFAASLPTEESPDSTTESYEQEQTQPENDRVLTRVDSFQQNFRNLMNRTSRFYRTCLAVAQYRE